MHQSSYRAVDFHLDKVFVWLDKMKPLEVDTVVMTSSNEAHVKTDEAVRDEDQLCEDQLREDQLREDQLCEDQLCEDQLCEDQRCEVILALVSLKMFFTNLIQICK